MTKPKPKKVDSLVNAMDEFANKLIEANKADNVAIATRLDVFKAVSGWVGIRNRGADRDSDEPPGEGLNAYRERLKSAPSERAPGARNQAAAGRASSAARNGTTYPDGNGGSALDAIKARIPKSNVVGDHGAGDGS